MGLAFVSVDFEARKHAFLFQQWLTSHSAETLRGFFMENYGVFLFLTDKRVGMWDSNVLKEKKTIELGDLSALGRRDGFPGDLVIAELKDGSNLKLSGPWVKDPDDIDVLKNVHGAAEDQVAESHENYLFDVTSGDIALPPSLQQADSKAAEKRALAWEKKRHKWEAGELSKEQARFAKEKERRDASKPLKEEFGELVTGVREDMRKLSDELTVARESYQIEVERIRADAKESHQKWLEDSQRADEERRNKREADERSRKERAAEKEAALAAEAKARKAEVQRKAEEAERRKNEKAEEAERRKNERAEAKAEQAVKKHVAEVQRGLLPGEECRAALGKTFSTVFVSNMRLGVAKSEAQIVDDVKLQDIESLRMVEGKLGWKLMLKAKGSEEVKLWSGDEAEAKRFLSRFEQESLAPLSLYSELLAKYESAMEAASDRTRKKAAPNRNWLLKALAAASQGKDKEVIRMLAKVLPANGSFDDFKAIVSRFTKAGMLPTDCQPVELFEGHRGWFASGGYVLVFPNALVVNGNFCELSASTHLAVIEEGRDNSQYVYEGQYFTGGAAVLLGRGASNRKVGSDDREAFLVLTDPKWQEEIELDPDRVGGARKFVARMEHLISKLQSEAPKEQSQLASPGTSVGSVSDELTQLKSLLDTGALKPEEYEAAKRRVLGL